MAISTRTQPGRAMQSALGAAVAALGPQRAGAGEGRSGTASTGAGPAAPGLAAEAGPCWPWLSGTAEGRKEAAAGAKDTLGSGSGRAVAMEISRAGRQPCRHCQH